MTKPPLLTPHGTLALPGFLPDATRGVVKTLDAHDVASTGIGALMVNALHLSSTPGVSVVQVAGGVHAFMGWQGPVASDSGGYQVFSLLAASPPMASVSARGFSYTPRRGGRKRLLDPVRSIADQLRLKADIIFCLDHCTHPKESADAQRRSVEHTLRWAAAARATFDARMASAAADSPPRLFAVVQGGSDLDLRKRCAEGLVEIGFDGYGFGGWPIADDGTLVDMVQVVADLLPADAPKHALGIGRPDNLVAAWHAGYDTFDCTIPTRLGRRGLVYLFTGAPLGSGTAFYKQLDLADERYRRDVCPLEDGCDCTTCRRHTRAYVSHLLAVKDPAGQRLATIHNLRFYARLVERLPDVAGA